MKQALVQTLLRLLRVVSLLENMRHKSHHRQCHHDKLLGMKMRIRRRSQAKHVARVNWINTVLSDFGIHDSVHMSIRNA